MLDQWYRCRSNRRAAIPGSILKAPPPSLYLYVSWGKLLKNKTKADKFSLKSFFMYNIFNFYTAAHRWLRYSVDTVYKGTGARLVVVHWFRAIGVHIGFNGSVMAFNGVPLTEIINY